MVWENGPMGRTQKLVALGQGSVPAPIFQLQGLWTRRMGPFVFPIYVLLCFYADLFFLFYGWGGVGWRIGGWGEESLGAIDYQYAERLSFRISIKTSFLVKPHLRCLQYINLFLKKSQSFRPLFEPCSSCVYIFSFQKQYCSFKKNQGNVMCRSLLIIFVQVSQCIFCGWVGWGQDEPHVCFAQSQIV